VTNQIAITYFFNGKTVILRYNRDDCQWKEAIDTLRQQNKTFRLTYV
jgi:hypothetical protein